MMNWVCWSCWSFMRILFCDWCCDWSLFVFKLRNLLLIRIICLFLNILLKCCLEMGNLWLNLYCSDNLIVIMLFVKIDGWGLFVKRLWVICWVNWFLFCVGVLVKLSGVLLIMLIWWWCEIFDLCLFCFMRVWNLIWYLWNVCLKNLKYCRLLIFFEVLFSMLILSIYCRLLWVLYWCMYKLDCVVFVSCICND